MRDIFARARPTVTEVLNMDIATYNAFIETSPLLLEGADMRYIAAMLGKT